MESKSNLDVQQAGKGIKKHYINPQAPLHVKELINELNEKTKLRKQGESNELIAKLITTNSGKKLGNNILSIDNSRAKSRGEQLAGNVQGNSRLNETGEFGLTVYRNTSNGATNSIGPLDERNLRRTDTASSGGVNAFQESSPQTVEQRKPQANSHSSYLNIVENLASSLSANQQIDTQPAARKERGIFRNFFRFTSSSNSKQVSTANKSIDFKHQTSDLSDSKSSLRSANQDRFVDSLLIVNTQVDPKTLPQQTVSSESVKCARSVNNRSHIENQPSAAANHIHHPLNSTANNSPNHTSQFDSILHKEANSLSSTSSIIPVSQSSSKSSFISTGDHHLSNYNLTRTETHLPTIGIKKSTTTDNHQFNLTKTSLDSTSTVRTVNDQSNSVPSNYCDQITKTVSTKNKNHNQSKKYRINTNCSSCGDHLQATSNSMSNGSNAAAQAAMQNADAYLSQLSAQQLNQLIMDQAFIPQKNATNSTHSNSLSNHGNGTLHDSESSEQFRRLLCRKCRPNRTGIVQHSHNSNTKFARNLHHSAMNMNPRHGWNALKEYSKGSIKRLKRHQKRLSGYARAMRKQYNHSGNSSGLTSGGDLSGDSQTHQAVFANMMLNAINTNKQLNNSPNFCKECYLEKMLAHQNNGLINNDYQKSPVCLSCVNMNSALSMLNGQPNYDLPPPPMPQTQKIPSSDFVDNAFVDRFFDVEQWRNKLRKERLRKKERNVLMVVSSIAIIVFIGISYFGTILFLRLTRLQNEEQ